ncbi:MAG: FG-GAP repeat domain-containing protein [Nitrospirota bacterium]
MKYFSCLLLTAYCLLLSSCTIQEFPGCCSLSGERDTPYTTTYTFNFKTGSGPLNKDNISSTFHIITGADIFTLLKAANTSQKLGRGIVSGIISDIDGGVQEIILDVTDKDGNNIETLIVDGNTLTNLFYNSLGRVPDFNLPGTSQTGGFTLFNVPPGEIFFWAKNGGRGSGRIITFKDSVSIGTVNVVSMTRANVGMIGKVVSGTLDEPVEGVLLEVIGIKKDETNKKEESCGLLRCGETEGGGLYVIGDFNLSNRDKDPETRDYRVENGFPVHGRFLIKASKNGYIDTYQSADTDIQRVRSLDAFQDITNNLQIYQEELYQTLENLSEESVDKNKGMIAGVVKSNVAGASGNQGGAIIRITDSSGSEVGSLLYFDGDENIVSLSTLSSTSDSGRFIAFNIPTGDVYIQAIAEFTSLDCFLEQNNNDRVSGSTFTISRKNSITIKDVDVQSIFRPSCEGEVFYTVSLSGKVFEEENGTGVSNVEISVEGIKGILAKSDTGTDPDPNNDGDYIINRSLIADDTYPLIGGGNYIIKIHDPGGNYVDTYQYINTRGRDTEIDLDIVSGSKIGTDNLPAIIGTVIDVDTGRTAEGVSIKAANVLGDDSGEISYLDKDGNIDITLDATSEEGKFIIQKIPIGDSDTSGEINISITSPGDSGNAIVRFYKDGVTLADIEVNKSIPRDITINGSVRNLRNNGIDSATVAILGTKNSFTSNSNGSFKEKFNTHTDFILKTSKTNYMNSYNYQINTEAIDMTADIYITSQSELTEIAANGGVKFNPELGVLAGETLISKFASPVAISTSEPPYSLAFGLLDKDSFIDIAAVNSSSNSISIFFGDGNAGFTESAESPITVGSVPEEMVITDFNLDGFPDIAVVNSGSNDVTILLGMRNNRFNPAVNYTSGVTAPKGITQGDFNGDGFADIAIADSGNGGVSILLNDGDGGFGEPTLIGVSSLPEDIAAADFDNDDILDLAIASTGSNEIIILKGDGTGNFISDLSSQVEPLGQYPTGDSPTEMVIGDFNRDKFLDVAVVNSGSNNVSILLCTVIVQVPNGEDTFRDCGAGGTGGGSTTDLVEAEGSPYSVGGNPVSIISGDFNENGILDLAVVNLDSTGDNAVSILTGNGDGTFAQPYSLPAGSKPTSILSVDLNRDNRLDLIVANSASNSISILSGGGVPLNNIAMEATDKEGNIVGDVRYFDASGSDIDSSLTATTDSGRFIIFNIPINFVEQQTPPDIIMVRASSGGKGNSIVTVYSKSLSYTTIDISQVLPDTISVGGFTIDPVGPDPGGISVNSVNISVLGTDINLFSSISDTPQNRGVFTIPSLDANSEYIFKLDKND